MTIAELIEIQEQIMKSLAINNRFIQNLRFIVHRSAPSLEGNKVINLIDYNSTVEIIMCLVKLLNHNEPFSFNRIFRMNPLNDSSINNEIKVEVLRDLRKELKTLQRYYRELQIEDIRNQYIAHLDPKGNEYRLDSIQINRIVSKTEDFFSDLLFAFLNSKFEYDNHVDDIKNLLKPHYEY